MLFNFSFLLIHIFIRFSVGLQQAQTAFPPFLALVYITRFSLISNRFVTTPKLIFRLWFDKWDPIRSQLLSHFTYHFQDIQIFICISSTPEPVIKLRARIKRQQHQRDCLISFLFFILTVWISRTSFATSETRQEEVANEIGEEIFVCWFSGEFFWCV